MKKITEIIETLFSTANQRIKSPFFGSFVFSWILVNWKPITYFIFSNDKVSVKIEKIEKSYEFIQNALFSPLLLSFIYVVCFPYVNGFIYKLTLKADKSKRKEEHSLKIDQIDKSITLAGKEKSLEDKRSGNKDVSQLNEKIDLLNKDNERLKETIQNKDEAISDYGEQLDKVTSEKQNIDIKLSKMVQDFEKSNIELKHQLEFRAFKKEKSFEAFLSIIESIKANEDLSEYGDILIKDYLDLGIIEKNTIGDYQFTQKGISFLSFFKAL
jgi:hypothetical protein